MNRKKVPLDVDRDEARLHVSFNARYTQLYQFCQARPPKIPELVLDTYACKDQLTIRVIMHAWVAGTLLAVTSIVWRRDNKGQQGEIGTKKF